MGEFEEILSIDWFSVVMISIVCGERWIIGRLLMATTYGDVRELSFYMFSSLVHVDIFLVGVEFSFPCH